MRRVVCVMGLCLGLSGCIGGGGGGLFGGGAGEGDSAADFVDMEREVSPGLASCLTAIGRSDMITDPEAEMNNTEIESLLVCTAERAQG